VLLSDLSCVPPRTIDVPTRIFANYKSNAYANELRKEEAAGASIAVRPELRRHMNLIRDITGIENQPSISALLLRTGESVRPQEKFISGAQTWPYAI
jgi:hypothetical protein